MIRHMLGHRGLLHALLVVALGACVSSCGEACVCVAGSLELFVYPSFVTAPADVTLKARAEGGRCGCSDGRPAEIVMYEWDLDGDGTVDQSGPDLDEVTITIDSPGVHYVRVWVNDTTFAYEDVVAIDAL
jgi:hypothetical protein